MSCIRPGCNGITEDIKIPYPTPALLKRCLVCGDVTDDTILQNRFNPIRKGKINNHRPYKITISKEELKAKIQEARKTRGGISRLAETLGVAKETILYHEKKYTAWHETNGGGRG